MAEYDLGLVVGSDGAKGDKGDKGDKGAKGDAGKGITSIQKTSSSGKVDTYTITYSDGSTSTFTVTNGSDASVTVDSSLSSTSVNPVQNKVIKTALDTKSDSSHNHDSRYYTETEMDTKLSGKANTSHTHNISDVSNLQSALDGKADDSDIPTKTSDLTNDGDGTNPFLTQHQSLASKTVTVEKQATAESGYFATYVIKQNNAQVGSKINIPKDYLVKSGSVKTCTTANQPVSGYKVGDKYIDFVVNTKDSSGTDEHIYILVSDLVEDTTYTADGTTLQLSGANVFSIKEVPKNKLASGVQTSLGYADTFNSSPCKNITSTQITNWDSMAGSGVTISDVDSEIDAYLDAIVTALGN